VITVKEIAQMCDVSPSTVSNILNGRSNMKEETRQKVLKVVKETGYKPNYFAQGMRRTNNKTICIITEEMCQFSSPEIVNAIMEHAETQGYRTFIINMSMYDKWEKSGHFLGDVQLLRENSDPAFSEAQAIRADGIIYIAAHGREFDIVPDNLDIPVVFAYGVSKDNKYKSVVIDDSNSSEKIVDYLCGKNYTRIGVIAGDAENMHTVWRLAGYKDGLEKHHITFDPDIVEYGNWGRNSGYVCAKKLLEKGINTIWCMNDVMAAGAYDFIREQGLVVGEDVSVFGFDDREIAEYMYPPLSTSRIMLEEIGTKSSELIIKEIENESFRSKKKEPFRIECKLIERNSVI